MFIQLPSVSPSVDPPVLINTKQIICIRQNEILLTNGTYFRINDKQREKLIDMLAHHAQLIDLLDDGSVIIPEQPLASAEKIK